MRTSNLTKIHRTTVACTAMLALLFASIAPAQDWDEMAQAHWTPGPAGPAPITGEARALDGLLFVGTTSNTNDPAGTLNDVFTVDPVADTSTSILTGYQVWGATADPANQRILFTRASGLTPTGGGDELFAVAYTGGIPVSLGQITLSGQGFRIDGLAISGGTLYGVNAGGGIENGFFSINWITLRAAPISTYPDSISGIDADPDTGVIYGVNDSTNQVVTIGIDGTITNVAAYPAGITDIDGIAVGGGHAYLVTDRGGPIPVYNICGGGFGTALTSPFVAADTFSGGAFATADTGQIFSDGFELNWTSVIP